MRSHSYQSSALLKMKFTLSSKPTTANLGNLQVCAVQTGACKMKCIQLLALPALQPLTMAPDDFSCLQASCDNLATARAKAAAGEIVKVRNGSAFQFIMTDGLLY